MFNKFSAEDCIERWNFVINQQCRLRMLSEIFNDAFKWVKRDGKPANKVKIYGSIVFIDIVDLNVLILQEVSHPDFPNNPESAFALFCLEKKFEVAEKNPGIKKQALKQKLKNLYDKKLKKLYNNLNDTQKATYIEKAQNEMREYLQKIEEFKYLLILYFHL